MRILVYSVEDVKSYASRVYFFAQFSTKYGEHEEMFQVALLMHVVIIQRASRGLIHV